MIFLYERGAVTIEEEFPIGQAPPSIKVGGLEYKKIINPVSFVVPPYMRAPGAKGSSADSCDRQASYLSSQKHIQDCQKIEREEAAREQKEKERHAHFAAAQPLLEAARQKDAEIARVKK